jgi:hypothetical protein
MQTPNAAAQIITSTGPRTIEGKRRSGRNAIKLGIFSKLLLLDGESRPDYERLLRGLWEYWEPEGAEQEVRVDRLAALYWRQGRVIAAEGAIIARSPAFVGVVTEPNSDLPRQDLLRIFLKDDTTPVSGKVALLRLTMGKLLELCEKVITRGFDFEKDTEALCDIYGNFDVHSDEGFCANFSELMLRGLRHKMRDGEKISEKNAREVAELINTEICRLLELLKKIESDDIVFNSLASLLPPQKDLDQIIRCENHLSREISKEVNQLEQLKRARRGYPPPPTIKVDLG